MTVALNQVEPIDALRTALQRKQEVVLSGVAGSGKTTLVRQLERSYLIAPTGKAARRLSQVTGRPANTVHSAVYGIPTQRWTRPDTGELCPDAMGQPTPCAKCTDCKLSLLWPAKEILLEPGMTLVVDEASMIDEAMASAVRNRVAELGQVLMTELRILWVGDPAQLPPVNGKPGVDLANPDIMLDKVWRTERTGILDFSTAIRMSNTADRLFDAIDRANSGEFDGVTATNSNFRTAAEWRSSAPARMLIVHTNSNRLELNKMIRLALDRGARLCVGDRLLIRSNNRDAEVLNGEVHVVTAIETSAIDPRIARVETVYDGIPRHFAINLELLDNVDKDAYHRSKHTVTNQWEMTDDYVNAQYGYTLTCHASQGSEADEVGVVWTSFDNWRCKRDESSFRDARAWLYTAVTRASKSLNLWTVRA